MKISEAIESIKEFFFELLGFILPGFTLLFLIYTFLTEKYQILLEQFFNNSRSEYFLILSSYITGYILFGFTSFWRGFKNQGKPEILFKYLKKNNLIEKKAYSFEVVEKISLSPTYLASKKLLEKHCKLQGLQSNINSFKEVRNLAMSFVPEADVKVYTFMFRATLSDNVGYAFKIVAFIGLFSHIFLCSDSINPIFKTGLNPTFFYLGLLFLAFFLRKTQRRFYEIALKIIFPIFLAKFNPINKE